LGSGIIKRKLVTSALPYVNNVPHLGNIICILSADCYSRYLRNRGRQVKFVCGTDDHGTTAETKALEEGITPQQLTDKYFKIHKEIYEWFNCKFDHFSRTSSKSNHEITIEIFEKLNKNGYIKEDEIEQSYCENCKKFLADRFVEGECPVCGYKDARGDQCENCGNLLNAIELINPKCKICGKVPITKKTKHLFIDLPKLASELKTWMEPRKHRWSHNARSMTESWLKEGLILRSITRDLKWGIPVPLKGFENKVFYSWFDAPIGYIGITKEADKEWETWWKNPKEVSLVQFMGKDNIPFHTILFPAFLIGTHDDYTIMDQISVNEYINYEGGMFSKSRNIGVFGDNAMQSGIPSDIWRYYMLINRPEKSDTEFTWKDFQEKINNELVANLGNLVNRTLTFIYNYFDKKIPNFDKVDFDSYDKKTLSQINNLHDKIIEDFENIKLKDALKNIMHISKVGNQYFQETQPWKTVNEDKVKAGKSLAILAQIVMDIAILIEPFMPDTSKKISELMNLEACCWFSFGEFRLKPGHEINKPTHLFTKLEDIKKYVEKYGKYDYFSKLDLRVAEIVNIKDHPEADKLYILNLDVGDQKRQIVSGLKDNYNKNDLKGKRIILISNLVAAKIRGVESKGMLLAGEYKKDVKVLTVKSSKPGTKVNIKGYKSNPVENLTYDQFSKVNLRVGKDNNVLLDNDKDKVLMADSEVVMCEGLKEGSKIK